MTRGFRIPGAALAALLALTLVAAPMHGALRATCDLCPPDCPMHQVGEGGKRLKCHGGAGVGHDDAQAEGGMPRLSKPPCGNHGALPGLALAPMILPSATSTPVAPLVQAAPRTAFTAPRRGADPPDTPPPIRLA
jgi:hypothetical protein